MKKLDRPVLAEGETTGHAHVLADNTVDVFETDEQTRTFILKKDTPVVHEEHTTITLPPGEYESDKVVEYDHFAEEARRVQD